MTSSNTVSERRRSSGIDWMLVLIVAVLIVLGIIMQYSASSYDLALVRKQGLIAAAGFVLMFLISRIPAGFWQKSSIFLYFLAAGLTAITRFIGREVKGARRWIEFRGFTFQTSELLKIALILAMATVICRYINQINNIQEIRIRDVIGKNKTLSFSKFTKLARGYLLMMGVIGFAALIVAAATKDLGTAVIIFCVGIIMMLVISPRIKYLIVLVSSAVVIGIGFVMAFPYRRGRITAWLNLEGNETDLGYQIKEGLYAIGSGGWFGKGLGRSLQKNIIPEPHTDMIFSIVCEEIGIIGGIVVIILFVLLILRLKSNYDEITDLYGKMIIAGVTSHIAVQVFVNLAVITNLIPNTGVPLPFISYGGASVLCLLIEIGLVMSVRRSALDRRANNV